MTDDDLSQLLTDSLGHYQRTGSTLIMRDDVMTTVFNVIEEYKRRHMRKKR